MYSMGLRYVDLTPIQRKMLKMKMAELEKLKYPRRPSRKNVLVKILDFWTKDQRKEAGATA